MDYWSSLVALLCKSSYSCLKCRGILAADVQAVLNSIEMIASFFGLMQLDAGFPPCLWQTDERSLSHWTGSWLCG